MHLAELNIAKLRYQRGDSRAAEFFDNIDRVNALAERMAGFVWRLKDDGGDATSFRIGDDPDVIVNLSVWETAEALEKFVFQTVHTGFYRKRQNWFEPMATPHFVMWWVAQGHRPDVAEASERLSYLTAHGPSDRAFGWESLRNVEMRKSACCG